MAIFRKGIKVGGYDIRVGFPRDKSYDRIDKDPRLSGKANPNTSVNRFRGYTQAAGGYSKPNRFIVVMTLPRGATDRGDVAADTQAVRQMDKSMSQQVAFHCSDISLPGRTIETVSQRIHGPERNIATGLNFAEVTAEFYCDRFMRERHYFETWQNLVINKRNYELNYYDEYTAPIDIHQLGDFDEQNLEPGTTLTPDGVKSELKNTVYACRLVEAYPTTIAAQPLAYSTQNQIHKVSITFQYRYWHNFIDIDDVERDDTFMSQQTGVVTPDTKGQGPFGIFRNLPSELRRAGNDILNQAKNRLPVGKVFGGRVFPPYL
tara:strand:- start:964 stop:1920 length:957 start_codon:yes stop_codon:yes gene_type:complete